MKNIYKDIKIQETIIKDIQLSDLWSAFHYIGYSYDSKLYIKCQEMLSGNPNKVSGTPLMII